jgi:hypothetical protein
MNVELLEKVKQHILENPESLDMGVWGCGSTACISGWAVRLSGRKDLHETHGEIPLELDLKQEGRLFYISQWPARFRFRFTVAISPSGKAKTAESPAQPTGQSSVLPTSGAWKPSLSTH